MIPGEESADETVKHPRLSSDTEETDAYSENESQDEMSLDYTTKKDSNENHILQNGKDTQQTEVRNCKNDNKTVNGYFHENELPVDLSNHKSKTCDDTSNTVKKDRNGFIGHHFLQKAYTVNRNSPNDFSFKPKKRIKKERSIKEEKGIYTTLNGVVRSEYDFNE